MTWPAPRLQRHLAPTDLLGNGRALQKTLPSRPAPRLPIARTASHSWRSAFRVYVR